VRRRELLRGLILAGAGLTMAGCGTPPAPASPTQAPSEAASSAPGWDAVVAAAQKEGKVVVSGPPDPGAGTRIPDAFKQRFGIDLEYLAGSSAQLAARIQSERAAGQYTMDVSLSGADTVYGTFLPNEWLEPLKPALILPEVTDGSVWRTGEPWFRDPEKRVVMQVFNTPNRTLAINTQHVSADELQDANALLDPKWRGKIGGFDPSVNGPGLAVASTFYVTKGPEFATKLYQGQQVAVARDGAQVADWVAHGSYPIGIGVTHQYLVPFYQAGLPIQELNMPDIPPITTGQFGLITLWKNAPHPNAAKVFVNWIASKEGLTLYAEIEGANPVRTDINPTWLPPEQVLKDGVKYFDTYNPDYVLTQRLEARNFYATIIK
jgi:iron(III) transport system substrate-binding protein